MKSPARPSLQATQLDAIRALAAVAVVLQHVRQLLFVPDNELPRDFSPGGFFSWLTSMGGQAVGVFFVLSGFLIASSIRSAWEKGRWSWVRYADARLTRLLVPLIPALLLTAFWDHLGLQLYGTVYPYGETLYDPASGHGPPNLLNFVGNALFLQGILVPRFGTNGPLWSLAPEFWYYAIFPLLFFAWKGGRPVFARVSSVALAVGLFVFIRTDNEVRFPLWLMGAALAFLPAPRRIASLPVRLIAFVVLGFTLVAGFLPIQLYHRVVDLLVAAGTSLLISNLLAAPKKPVSRGYERIAGFGADFSYTLYLVHFPLLAFLSAALFRGGPRWTLTPVTAFSAIGVFLLVSLYTTAAWSLFERNTKRIRTSLVSKTTSRVRG